MYSTAWQLSIFALPGLQTGITPTKLSGSAWQLLWPLRAHLLSHLHRSHRMWQPEASPDPGQVSPGFSPSKFSPQQIPTDHTGQPRAAAETCMRQKLSSSQHHASISLKGENNLLPPAAGAQQSCVAHFHSAHISNPLGLTGHTCTAAESWALLVVLSIFSSMGSLGEQELPAWDRVPTQRSTFLIAHPSLPCEGKTLKSLCVCVWF